MLVRLGLCVLSLTLLAACAPTAILTPQTAIPTAESQSFPTSTPSSVAIAASAATAMPVPSPQKTTAPTATSTTAPRLPALCSPLDGIALNDLAGPDLLKNAFQAPLPGMDDGHHGADFAYWSRGERKTMLGLPVHSALTGKIAGVIRNRPPYGFAVIIETPLESIPTAWLEQVPTPAPTTVPAPNLYCPSEAFAAPTGNRRSLYLLYAHLNLAPTLAIGDPVTCDQPIGEVGTTGKSVNPHLHLETRVGPSNAQFAEMAHYINDATEGEMRNYCAWRVSGLFQMFDPLRLLSLQP